MKAEMQILLGRVDGLQIEIIDIYRLIEQLSTDSKVSDIADRLSRRLDDGFANDQTIIDRLRMSMIANVGSVSHMVIRLAEEVHAQAVAATAPSLPISSFVI